MNQNRRLIIACLLVVFSLAAVYGTQQLGGLSWIIQQITGETVDGRDLAQGSQQKAIAACQRAVRSELGTSIMQMRVDESATRYSQSNQTYRIFFNLELRGAEREDNYAECEVNAVSQRINRTRFNGPGFGFSLF